MSIIFGEKNIADYTTPYIIAELGSNHNGDMSIARELIVKAKQAGCDCVKFQSWSKDTIFSKKVYQDNYFLEDDYRNRTDYTLEQIIEKFSISEKQLYEMKNFCDEMKIDFASTPFSKREVDFLTDELNVHFIKVASMDLNNYPFLDYIARKGKPVVLATGLSTIAEIAKAVEIIESAGNNKLILLHCVSLYPPDDTQVHLNNLELLRNTFGYPVGFSDHTLGTIIPLASVVKGACIIEKHFTLDKNMFGWDHKVSADFDEMRTIVDDSRRICLALGSSKRTVSERELKKRNAFRRSIVAAKNIAAGSVISEDDLDLKRPGTGIPPEQIKFVVGKTAKRTIAYDEILSMEDF